MITPEPDELGVVIVTTDDVTRFATSLVDKRDPAAARRH